MWPLGGAGDVAKLAVTMNYTPGTKSTSHALIMLRGKKKFKFCCWSEMNIFEILVVVPGQVRNTSRCPKHTDAKLPLTSSVNTLQICN